MLLKSLYTNVLRGVSLTQQRKFLVPKRTWAQVGTVISTPPRVEISFGEQLFLSIILLTIWLGPTFYFMTQLKVWRRCYIES